MRKSVYEEQGVLLKPETAPAARNQSRSTRSCAARPPPWPKRIAEIDKIGVGGLILVFRIGPMPGRGRRAEHPALHGTGRAEFPLDRRLRAA